MSNIWVELPGRVDYSPCPQILDEVEKAYKDERTSLSPPPIRQ
jgi:hypothetical protein